MGDVRRVGRPRARCAPVRVIPVAALVIALVLAGCSDDGSDGDGAVAAASSSTTTPAPGPHGATSSTTLATGGLDVVVPEGWSPIPLPSLGIGLGVPSGWQATVLTAEALDRLGGLAGASRGFVEAARNAAGSGASLYAAGVDGAGRVSDLKLLRLPRPDAERSDDAAALERADDAAALERADDAAALERADDAAALERAAAQALAAAPPGAAAGTAAPGGPRNLVRLAIRFTVSANGVEAHGTQWLVAGPDAVWSLVVTSEDAAGHDALATAVADSVTFGA